MSKTAVILLACNDFTKCDREILL